jgi:putative transposase
LTSESREFTAEIKRRTRVVGIVPNDASAMRLITAVCVETHEEWLVAEKRYMSEGTFSIKIYNTRATAQHLGQCR